jgi:ribosomal protein S18 acetylase RimI-like enzyme
MTIEFRILRAADAAILDRVADGVFDEAVQPALAREFLNDARHHLAVALDAGVVVGFASGVHYVHPDKPAELWINEVGVAPTHTRRGLAQALLRLLFDTGRSLGCSQAWVLTDRDNTAAMRLYASVSGDPGEHEHVMFEFELQEARNGLSPRRQDRQEEF